MREYVTTAGLVALLALTGQGYAGQGERQQGDQGTVEDTLPAPANEVGNQSDSDSMSSQPAGRSEESGKATDGGIAETAVPGAGASVTGTIQKLNAKSGYFTLKTVEGESVQLHADPALLKQQAMTKGSEVTAHYEQRGKMKHVTLLEPSSSGALGGRQQQTEPSPEAPGGQR